MRQIILNLDSTDNKFYYQNLIREGENLASEIVINLSEEFQGFRYLIKFKNNENLEVITQELIPIENQIKYAITNPLTKDAGTLRIELNAFDDTGMLKKTATTTLRVLDALGETDAVVPEAYVPWYIQVFDLVENFTSEEAARVEAENLRVLSETSRTNAETSRTNAENSRVTAENNRALAEQQRVEADILRGQTVEAIEQNYAPRLTAAEEQINNLEVQQQVTPILQPYESHIELYRVAIIHDADDNIYATYSRTGAAHDFEKSTDKGVTWIKKSTLPASMKCITKISATGTLIAIAETSTSVVSNPRLWRSTDDGETWVEISAGLAFPPLSSQGVVETPSGAICIGEYGNIANHSYRIMRSTDDGLTWNSVLASPGTDPQGDPGHIHSVTYDAYANKLIAFMDRPSNSNYGARIYVSDDNGATWTILGVVDANTKPNFVSPMYFETHIAWGSDNERNGVISRISREDFYSGKFNEVEDVARLNKKAFYYTFPIREGVWVVSMATETVASEIVPEGAGTYSNEVIIVSDNGKVVSGGITHYRMAYNSVPFQLAGRRIYFPSYVYNRVDHNGQSWMNLTTGGPREYGLLPYSQGVGLPSTRTDSWVTKSPVIPNMLPLYGKGTDGVYMGMIYTNANNQVVVYNSRATNGAEIRMSADGTMDFYYSGSRVAYISSEGKFVAPGIHIETNGVRISAGSGSPEGKTTSVPGSIYLNYNGGMAVSIWTKISGTGNTGWLPVGANRGTTEARPTITTIGMYYFDTTLNKPIWRNSANNGWVDATGTAV